MPLARTAPRLAALALGFVAPLVQAQLQPDGASVQLAVAPHGTRMVGAGLIWDADWSLLRRGLFTLHGELILGHWRARAAGSGDYGLTQVALLPVLRIRPERGRAAWFMELGIGASWLSRSYRTPDKTFGSRWNFYDMAGVGISLGAQRRQEVGLRYVHISNAGLRDPNPGEDFLMLRYAVRF